MRKSLASMAACLGLFALVAMGSIVDPPPASAATLGCFDCGGPAAYVDGDPDGAILIERQIHGQDLAAVPIRALHKVAVEMSVPSLSPGLSPSVTVPNLVNAAAREVGGARITPSPRASLSAASGRSG